jgi:nicotinamidase-related amidase
MNCSSFTHGGPARALLICVTETIVAPSTRPLGASVLETAGSTLLSRWEKADWPAVFVEPDHVSRLAPSYSMSGAAAGGGERGPAPACSDPSRRPTPDDFVFQTRLPSLLRHRRFARLFEGLGGPLLILLGDELGEIVLQTAIDGFLAGHPIIIVKDAVPPGHAPSAATEASRAAALPLLTCFARLMSAAELTREWTGAE